MEEIVEKRKRRFFDFFKKDPYFWILIAILILAVILRIYFFDANHGNQWWDESVYSLKSKMMADNSISEGLKFGPHRGFAMEIFWSLFFKLGIGEFGMRLTELILSFLAVLLTYLIGKELCSKKVALIASAFMAVFWLGLFYTIRIMLTIPTLFFWVLTCYLFWIGYVKKKIKWVMLLIGVLLIVGMFVSLLYAPIVIFLGLFLLISDKFQFLKNKWVYFAGIVSALFLIPYILWSKANLETPFVYWFSTLSVGSIYDKTFSANSGIMGYVNFFPSYLGWFLLIIFFIGLLKILDIFLGFDLLLKGDEKMKKKLFLLLWIVVPIVANALLVPAFSVDYYLMQIFPAVFLVVGEGIIWIGDLIGKYQKYFGLLAVIALVIIGGIMQFNIAKNMISFKADSYSEVRDSGLWIKEDSNNVSDIVISHSGTMTAYFSERKVIQYPANESDFDKIVQEENPKYMIVSLYESPPQWTFDYYTRHNDTWIPVQVYTRNENGQNSPILIIFKAK